MKKATFLSLLLFLGSWLFGADLQFQSPTVEEPWYRINFDFEVKKERAVFSELQLNGEKFDKLSAFNQGKRADLSKPLEQGIYNFSLDYAWKNNQSYSVVLFYKNENSDKVRKIESKGLSPEKGGIPAGKEGFYRVFIAEENAGLERFAEISYLTLTASKKELENETFIILDGNSLVDYQLLESGISIPVDKAAKDHPETLTYNIAFPLNIAAGEKKILLVLKGEAKPSESRNFVITGEGLGKTVKSRKVSLEFHLQSGQINIIEFLNQGIKLHNREAGVIHWNPDVFIPGVSWDHSFNWNPPPVFEEKTGELLYLNSRRGPMEAIKEVILEVKYILPFDSPYFISETKMRVEKGIGVIALRNDEMVLHKELFDSLAYRDKKGEVVIMPLKEKLSHPDGLVHVAPDDLGWVGLLNTEKKYGFFSLRIEYENSRLNASGNWLHKPGTYFYAPSDGKYVYWVRPLLYTWSEFTTRNILTYLPEGSSFFEKNAYTLLRLTDDFPAKLDILLKKLRNPVRID